MSSWGNPDGVAPDGVAPDRDVCHVSSGEGVPTMGSLVTTHGLGLPMLEVRRLWSMDVWVMRKEGEKKGK